MWLIRIQEFYTDLLSDDYIKDRQKEIRRSKGKGHAGVLALQAF